VLCLQIDALLGSYQQEHGDRTELLHSAIKTADLGILLGAPLPTKDYSMTRVAGLLSDALATLSSGENFQLTAKHAFQYLLQVLSMSVLTTRIRFILSSSDFIKFAPTISSSVSQLHDILSACNCLQF